jgi:hypothetical protein
MSRSLDAALEISGLSKDEIDLFDLYSSVFLLAILQRNSLDDAVQLLPHRSETCLPLSWLTDDNAAKACNPFRWVDFIWRRWKQLFHACECRPRFDGFDGTLI